ncbi:MAG: flagellar protein export ATPase FliI [Clostridia bacterium]|nr:flagellar protein export ATPase FliI [Clostridia bacterium]
MILEKTARLIEQLNEVDPFLLSGRVEQVVGLSVESAGPLCRVGDLCRIEPQDGGEPVLAEAVGFREHKIILMPFGRLSGIQAGCRVEALGHGLHVPIGQKLCGRILDGLGRPMDGLGPLQTEGSCALDNQPPNPLTRQRISEILPLGIRAIDGLLTCGRGQRLGIFAGSGVGKSTLLGMIARNAASDINVISLVGERGREVREFIEKDLREEGLKKSVVVVATSDQPAMIRQKSALLSTAIAESFRRQGLHVLLLMDSLTRFAMAQREIGMAVGEPPVARGYTPSVYEALPRLLERSGNADEGSITGLYTVLVDGDDLNEPVADTVRGILDGHIVLSRTLANQGHYPAIDVLSSISRSMSDLVTEKQWQQASRIRRFMSLYHEAQDIIQIGAYKKGTDPELDEAIFWRPAINKFLQQKIDEADSFPETLRLMEQIGGGVS